MCVSLNKDALPILCAARPRPGSVSPSGAAAADSSLVGKLFMSAPGGRGRMGGCRWGRGQVGDLL